MIKGLPRNPSKTRARIPITVRLSIFSGIIRFNFSPLQADGNIRSTLSRIMSLPCIEYNHSIPACTVLRLPALAVPTANKPIIAHQNETRMQRLLLHSLIQPMSPCCGTSTLPHSRAVVNQSIVAAFALLPLCTTCSAKM